MISVSDEVCVSNTHITDEIYFGYSIRFRYNQMSFEWPNDNVIYLIEKDQKKHFLEVSPDMDGLTILNRLKQEINTDSNISV